MTYFVDECLSDDIPCILRMLEVDAVHLRERFVPSTPDTVWLPWVGESGWVVVTADTHQRTVPAECAAYRQHQLRAVFLYGRFLEQTLWQQMLWFLKHWPTVERELAKHGPGTCLRASRSGQVKAMGKPRHRG